MRRLTIDCSAETATLRFETGVRTFGGQWVQLYLALAAKLRCAPAAFVSASELASFGRWRSKRPASVGKEVARHLELLERAGLGGLVSWYGRTKRWRLELDPEEVEVLPGWEEAECWLEDQRDLLQGLRRVPDALSGWLIPVVRALIRLQEGRIREGVRLTQQADEATTSGLLCAIAELIRLRLWSRIGEYPDDLRRLQACGGRIGEALCCRARLVQALAPGACDPGRVEAQLRLISTFEDLPDVNALGLSYNALGVLTRRNGDPAGAARYLRYAVALLLATFDLPTAQAALFNLGHALYKLADGDEDLEEARRMLLLARELRETLGLGRDFAQGEVVLGLVASKLGRLEEARRWQEEARSIVETLISDYDRAEVELLGARLDWVESWSATCWRPDPHVVAAYERAADLLLSTGFSSEDVRRELCLYRRGVRPLWLRFEATG